MILRKVKRKFLNLMEMEKEDPNELQICECDGQDFEFNSKLRNTEQITSVLINPRGLK